MIIPLFIPSASYGSHTTVINRTDMSGVTSGLSRINDALGKTNGHLSDISTELSAEKHLITVTAGEIHAHAVAVGQHLWDVREQYRAHHARVTARIEKVRSWQYERRVRRTVAEVVDEKRSAYAFWKEDVDANKAAYQKALAAATAEFEQRRTTFMGRLFSATHEIYEERHNVRMYERLWWESLQRNPLPFEMVQEERGTGRDAMELFETSVRINVRGHGGVYLPDAGKVNEFGVKKNWLNNYVKVRSSISNNDNWLSNQYTLDRLCPEPPYLDLTDEICELAEVTRFTPSATVQLRRTTLFAMSKIVEQIA